MAAETTSARQTAMRVIETEIDGLKTLETALTGALGEAVDQTIELIKSAAGRVIVTGIGKSGHVARKIAATLASTGCPSIYVHPAEASHGDLGMIASDDVVLALSKSGETEELNDIVAYSRRFAIPIVALTHAPQSTLATNSTIVLCLPAATEACDETRAPTTSTTMAMAMGDALAVALLRSRGFTATDFQGFHPGGALGAALRRVGELMDGDKVPLVGHDATISETVHAIEAGNYGCVGVVNKTGDLVGILTDGDLRRRFANIDPQATVQKVMTVTPKTVTPDTLSGDALAIMSADKITALFVVKAKKPVGLLHLHHCLASGVA